MKPRTWVAGMPRPFVRTDDVASVLLSPGEVIFEIAKRFRGIEDHMPYVARLPWRTFLDDERDS